MMITDIRDAGLLLYLEGLEGWISKTKMPPLGSREMMSMLDAAQSVMKIVTFSGCLLDSLERFSAIKNT